MKTAKVTFKKCIQDSQEYGSDDEHMVSRIFFDVDIDGEKYEELCVDVKQTVGSDFETSPLEVGIPKDYQGALNYQAFRQAVEAYYRSLVGSQARGIRISGGANIRMHDNIWEQTTVVEFPVQYSDKGW